MGSMCCHLFLNLNGMDDMQPVVPVNIKETIEAHIRKAIAAGRWKPGSRVPAERTLARQFHASKSLIHHIYSGLARRHALVMVHGKGCFVADRQTARTALAQKTVIRILLPYARALTPPYAYWYNLMETFEGIVARAQALGLMPVPLYLGENADDAAALAAAVNARELLGIIDPALYLRKPGMVQIIHRRRIPFAQMGRYGKAHDRVWDDHESACQTGIRRLIQQGRKCIAFIGAGVRRGSEDEKLAGFRRAHWEAGRRIRHGLISQDRRVLETGGAVLLRLLDQGFPIDAVMALNDYVARLVMDAAQTKDIQVPKDVAVIGADDMPGVERWAVPLATIRRPRAEIGRTLVDLIVLRYTHPDALATVVKLECQYVHRASAG